MMKLSPLVSPLAALVRAHDPDRFLTSLFAPAELRETLYVLYAFNHELARAREVVSHPMLALIRLQWWREVVEGARRRHEVAWPLGEALDEGRVSAAELLEMISAREMEAEGEGLDRAAWLGMISGGAGALAVAAGRVLGAEAAELARLRALGGAYGVAGVLRSVGVLARQGRCLLPVDVLGGYGVTVEQVVADPLCAQGAVAALAEEGWILVRAGGGRFSRGVVSAGLVGVLARRDLGRIGGEMGGAVRGLGDKAAVVWGGVARRV